MTDTDKNTAAEVKARADQSKTCAIEHCIAKPVIWLDDLHLCARCYATHDFEATK